MEHARQEHMISREETFKRCRCSGGITSPHSSQTSWVACSRTATSAAFFSVSSWANRRSEEKAEKVFLLPCSTIYLSSPRSIERSSQGLHRPRAAGWAPDAAAEHPG